MEYFGSYPDVAALRKKAEAFCRCQGELRVFNSGEIFQKAGSEVRSFGYVIRGGVRYSCYGRNGKMHTVGFAFEGSVFADYSSCLQRIPSRLEITFIEKTEVYVVAIDKVRRAIISDSVQGQMFRHISDVFFIRVETRLLDFYTMTPEERYFSLLRNSPELFKRISLKDMAAYIGVTPETLSRIRKRIAVRGIDPEKRG